MLTCPHCEGPGIGITAKLLANPVYPAVCRLCGRPSSHCANVYKVQLVLALGFMAAIPYFETWPNTKALGAAAAVVIIMVGLLGPMCRR